MLHVIIRTCLRDDGIAKICYDSFIYNKIEAKYSFLADFSDKYKYINEVGVPIYFHRMSNNFGGLSGAKRLIWGIRNNYKSFDNNDYIILCDSDIIVYSRDFLNKSFEFEHSGIGGIDPQWPQLGDPCVWPYKLNHISGQLCIIKGEIINKLISLTSLQIEDNSRQMVKNGMNVCDDAFISYMTDIWKCKKYTDLRGYWKHHKAYNLIGKNISEIMEILKNEP